VRNDDRGITMDELIALLRRLEASGFYGSLEVKFETGRVVIIRKTETLKPGLNHRDTRGNERDKER